MSGTLLDIGESSAKESEREEDDFYPTPREVTQALIDAAWPGRKWAGVIVVDLGCGNGDILDVFFDLGASTYGVELHPERAAEADRRGHVVFCGDVLGDGDALIPRAAGRSAKPGCIAGLLDIADVVAMNSPFKLAQEFCEVALKHRHESTEVASLLRGTFLEGLERIDFHRANPAEILQIPNRIDFTRGAVRKCPRCDATGREKRPPGYVPKPREPGKPDPERCLKCRGKGYVKGGNDSAAVQWWGWGGVFAPGTYRVLDPVRVPKGVP